MKPCVAATISAVLAIAGIADAQTRTHMEIARAGAYRPGHPISNFEFRIGSRDVDLSNVPIFKMDIGMYWTSGRIHIRGTNSKFEVRDWTRSLDRSGRTD